MICRIGLFKFDAHTITGWDSELSVNYATIQRIGNNPYRQDIGGHDEKITVTGTMLKKSVGALDYFKIQAKTKKPVRFSTTEGSALVLIESVREARDIFFRGVYLENAYEISMVRYWGRGDIALLQEIAGAIL